jgi:glutathione synthase/RimK-type ligase-like ATP-grasp enzyme
MGIDPDYAGVVAEEWKYLRIGIWEALRRAGIPLVSDPDAIRRAEAKTAQLALAHDAGLTVPDTLITNDHEAFLAFCDKHDGALVFKKLRSHSIIAPSGAALFATKLLESPAQIAPGELALCPVIFQQVVESRLDCRILVVGNSVYGFKMHTRESENIGLDYRADIQSMKAVKHEYYDPPEAVSRACVMMCRAFGLNFGAFDFAIDADGRHVFFELNANGQWLWLQIATGFPLTDRIALFLAEGAAASNPAAVNQSEAWRYATALPA